MGMNFVSLGALVLAALSLFYTAVYFKLAINSPLLLFMALLWMIVIALIIKASSGDEVTGFYSSIFLHPLSDHSYALRSAEAAPAEPALDRLLGLTLEEDLILDKDSNLVAVIQLESAVQAANLEDSKIKEICEQWSKFLAQLQSSSSLKSYFSLASNEGDSIQAFLKVKQYQQNSYLEYLQKQSLDTELLHKDNILSSSLYHQSWFKDLIQKQAFIADWDFYLIIKQQNTRNKIPAWLKFFRKKSTFSSQDLEEELKLLEQKIELSLLSLQGLGIKAKQVTKQSLKDFYQEYHPSQNSSITKLYDRAKFLELGQSYHQTLRFSCCPEEGELGLWLYELLSQIKSKAYLSVSWTHRDAHKDRRTAEQKAEVLRQMPRSNKSRTQSIIKENAALVLDLMDTPHSYDLSILLSLENSSLADLDKESLRLCKSYQGARLTRLDRQQLHHFISNLPFASSRLKPSELLFASHGFAGSCFIFIANDLGTREGPLLGLAWDNMKPIYLDEYDRKVCHNRSINFIGDSGSGKTVAAKLAVKRRLERGGSFVIIDNTTDGWDFFVNYYGGSIVEIDSSPSPDDTAYFAALAISDNASSAEINQHIERVIRLLSLLKNRDTEISIEEEFFLLRVLNDLYKQKLKPSLSELYEHLSSYNQDPNFSTHVSNYQKAIAPYSRICGGLYSGLMDASKARISDKSKLLLVTFSKVAQDANFLPVALFLVMNYVSQRVIFQKESALTLIVDEAWKIFTGTKAKLGKDTLSFFARAGRGMDLGLWTISQKPQDLPREVHSSASCTLCFQLKENSDKQDLILATGLKDKERDLVYHHALSEAGTCFLKTTRSAGLIQIRMDEMEAVLSNSTRDFVDRRTKIMSRFSNLDLAQAAAQTLQELLNQNQNLIS